jgi:hypothetical protein
MRNFIKLQTSNGGPMFALHWTFLTEHYTGHKGACAVCNQVIDEGYALDSDTQEECDRLTRRFGDVTNWFVGECCFGRYYFYPNGWLDYLKSKENGKE